MSAPLFCMEERQPAFPSSSQNDDTSVLDFLTAAADAIEQGGVTESLERSHNKRTSTIFNDSAEDIEKGFLTLLTRQAGSRMNTYNKMQTMMQLAKI